MVHTGMNTNPEPADPKTERLMAGRKRRRKIVIWLLAGFFVVFVLPVASVLLYAQSSHAFHHFILPAIDKATQGLYQSNSD